MGKRSFQYQPKSKIEVNTHQQLMHKRGQEKAQKAYDNKVGKFDGEKAHYLEKLEWYVSCTIAMARKISEHPDITDKEAAYEKLVKQHDKEWKALVSRVNRFNKVVRLDPASYRKRLHEVGEQATQDIEAKAKEQASADDKPIDKTE